MSDIEIECRGDDYLISDDIAVYEGALSQSCARNSFDLLEELRWYKKFVSRIESHKLSMVVILLLILSKRDD